MCAHKHSRFDTNPCGELLSSPAITSCHWTSLMYLSGCVSQRAGWLNAGLQQFTTSKACQSAPGAPETSLCQWGIISEGWHRIRGTGGEISATPTFDPTPKMKRSSERRQSKVMRGWQINVRFSQEDFFFFFFNLTSFYFIDKRKDSPLLKVLRGHKNICIYMEEWVQSKLAGTLGTSDRNVTMIQDKPK